KRASATTARHHRAPNPVALPATSSCGVELFPPCTPRTCDEERLRFAAYLNTRNGGVSDPGSARSSVRMTPQFKTLRFEPNPSMDIELPNAADVTPGIDDGLS